MVTIKEPKRYVLIGTAGHIDHGKTELVRNFTGCETDRLPEEKSRGMSIDLGFASCLLKGNTLAGIVDVPGHEKFIRNMVAGVAAIDAMVLVVAADDGIMPQTREHMQILELMGITKGLVAVTKVDMVDGEMVELVVDEIRDYLAGTFLDGAPVLPLSSITGEGMEAFWEALNTMVAAVTPRDARGLFRMPVERKFQLKGLGTVTTGMPLTGRVKLGDLLELQPSGRLARVRGMQVYKKKSRFAVAGECVAINVPDLDYDEVNRGDVLCVPGHFRGVRMVDAKVRVLESSVHALKDRAPIRFHVGTAEAMGRAVLLDRQVLEPGGEGYVQFRLESPVVVDGGDRFIVRLQSPTITVGGGTVLREQDVKLKKHRAHVLADLREHEEAVGSDRDRVVFAMRKAGIAPLKAPEIVKRSKVPAETVEEILAALRGEGAVYDVSTFGLVHRAALDEAAETLLAELRRFHAAHPFREGMEVLDLRSALGADKNAFELLVTVLADENRLRRTASVVSDSAFQVELDDRDQGLMDPLEEAYREGRFAPPSDAALAESLGAPADRVARLTALLEDRGRLVPVAESIRFHADAVAEAEELLVAYLKEHGELGAVSFRDLIGASRKFAYPLLDYFDIKGVTVRKGNLRYLKSRGRGAE